MYCCQQGQDESVTTTFNRSHEKSDLTDPCRLELVQVGLGMKEAGRMQFTT